MNPCYAGLSMFCLLAVLSTGAASADATSGAPRNRAPVLNAFSYRDVTLTGGPLENQAREARDFYLGLSEDSLLHGFRLRAGLPAPGKPMGGWYDPDGFAGAHPFGQYLSALARMYANTGDRRFKAKVARLVHGFHQTLGPDGYFYSSRKVAREWPCYLYDKNCIGMRDAYTLTGNREALVVLKKMTDWAEKNLPRRSDEWYTLPENLYNCYALTHEERYLRMARAYDYSGEYYDLFAKGVNAFTPNRHAYSHVNTLCSAARAYEATGDEKYLTALEQAWTFLTTTQMYASGGWGPRERFVEPGKGKLAASLAGTDAHFETPCGAYANANVDRYLLRFTGDAKYGDNMERVIFNGMLAALPMQPNGKTFYYSDYRPGAQKGYFPDAWPCCSGTYAQITADYPLDIFFHSDHALYVNLFAQSRVTWRTRGGVVRVEQTNRFPEDETISLTVHTTSPAKFSLCVRVPYWVSGAPFADVNGAEVAAAAGPGTFLQVDRTWRDGDMLRVRFPMGLRYEAIAPENPDTVAVMYGPFLLVALSDHPVALSGATPPLDAQPPSPTGTLPVFRMRDGAVTFLPFYKVRDESYTTYQIKSSGG